MAVRTAGRGRFAVLGEPIVALDLIDTVAAPGLPAAEDLLSAHRDAGRTRVARHYRRAGRT